MDATGIDKTQIAAFCNEPRRQYAKAFDKEAISTDIITISRSLCGAAAARARYHAQEYPDNTACAEAARRIVERAVQLGKTSLDVAVLGAGRGDDARALRDAARAAGIEVVRVDQSLGSTGAHPTRPRPASCRRQQSRTSGA